MRPIRPGGASSPSTGSVSGSIYGSSRAPRAVTMQRPPRSGASKMRSWPRCRSAFCHRIERSRSRQGSPPCCWRSVSGSWGRRAHRRRGARPSRPPPAWCPPLLHRPTLHRPALRQPTPREPTPRRSAQPARASRPCQRPRARPFRNCSPARLPLCRPHPRCRSHPLFQVLHHGLPQRRATVPHPRRRLAQPQAQQASNAPSARHAGSSRNLPGPHPASPGASGPRPSWARRAAPPQPPARAVRLRPQPTPQRIPTAPATTCSTCSAIRNDGSLSRASRRRSGASAPFELGVARSARARASRERPSAERDAELQRDKLARGARDRRRPCWRTPPVGEKAAASRHVSRHRARLARGCRWAFIGPKPGWPEKGLGGGLRRAAQVIKRCPRARSS